MKRSNLVAIIAAMLCMGDEDMSDLSHGYIGKVVSVAERIVAEAEVVEEER
jgi:hypothetical protein